MSNINWHRLFGLTLTDLFTDLNYQVDLETDLSIKRQYLDIVIIKKNQGKPFKEIPSGLEHLVEHNLLTYKSLQEPLDEWTIEELIGYYSNYRKLVSPSLNNLLPTSQFKLYAVSTRYPSKLLNKRMIFNEIQPGVFDLTWGSRLIQLIVLNRIKKQKKNSVWQLFSGLAEGFIYGNEHYDWRCPSERAVLNQLYELYQTEGVVMSYTMEDFNKDFTKEHLYLLAPEDRLKGLQPEDRLKGLPPETIFKQFPIEERLKGLPAKLIKEYLLKLKDK